MTVAEGNEASPSAEMVLLSFVFDTSAFISLESVGLLDLVLKNFRIVTSPSAYDELNDFAIYEDALGQAAERVLKKKQKIVIEKPVIKEKLIFVSQIDNEIFNLALKKNATLITDDIKLTKHAESKVRTEFSTHFLSIFLGSGLLTKIEALQKLEQMRKVRNWQENVIYLSAKEEITKNDP